MVRALRYLFLFATLLIGVAAACWWAILPPPVDLPFATDFALVDVTVVNPGLDRADHQVVVVRGSDIERVSNVIPQRGARRLEQFHAHYVLPGLIDLHSHLPPDNALELTQHALLLYLAYGVTTIREVGDVDGTAVPAARTLVERDLPGPRLIACGPFIAGGTPRWKNTIVMHDPSEAKEIVTSLRKAGFRCVKSYDELSADEMDALIDAANGLGMPVLGHIPLTVPYERSNLPEVQHLHGVIEPEDLHPDDLLTRMIDWDHVDEARIDAFVDSTVRRHIAHTPTLISAQQLLRYADYAGARQEPFALLMPRLYRDVVWDPRAGLPQLRLLTPPVLEKLRAAFGKRMETVRRLYRAGAELRLGTDVQQPLVVPGFSLHQEMRLFAEAGMPADLVLATASWRAGAVVREPLLGQIVDGAPADLLIFRDDPSRSLDALDSLVAVVSRGKLYRREDLLAQLQRYQAHFSNLIFDQVSMLATRRVLSSAINAAPTEVH